MSTLAESGNGSFLAVKLAGDSRWLRRLAWLLLVLMVLFGVLVLRVPWRQNLPGVGRVIEYDPVNRPMPIQARTDGLVLKWHVREGQRVAVGDPIVDLADNDPLILERLRDQMSAAEAKLAAARAKSSAYGQQLLEAQSARTAAIRMADDDVVAAEQAVKSVEQSVAVAQENLKLNEFQKEMVSGLVKDEIAPGFELERAKQQLAVAQAELVARQAQVAAAEATLRARKSARERVERDEQVKVHAIQALQETAEGEVAEAQASILRLRSTIERQNQQSLIAPLAGTVQNLLANGQGGGFVKAGANLATLVPDSNQLAVELLVDGNDVTFMDVGSHVRLQFEGWPAVQFVGWPSAAVGTFGGRVAFVDRFDSGNGDFRVMVLPDERALAEEEGMIARGLRRLLTIESEGQSSNPHAWPDSRYLRQGVRAKGWVMLREVRLWFEIWRRLNGFPPSLNEPPGQGYNNQKGSGDSGDAKPAGAEK
jgi:multidrug efflux pump subunit AcrA (membrane-fusion protein)